MGYGFTVFCKGTVYSKLCPQCKQHGGKHNKKRPVPEKQSEHHICKILLYGKFQSDKRDFLTVDDKRIFSHNQQKFFQKFFSADNKNNYMYSSPGVVPLFRFCTYRYTYCCRSSHTYFTILFYGSQSIKSLSYHDFHFSGINKISIYIRQIKFCQDVIPPCLFLLSR